MNFPKYEHHIYDEKFPIIFHYDTLPAENQSNYFPNWHGAIELLYFRQGIAQLSLNGEKTEATPGDIIVINSSVVHNINAKDGFCSYYCLIIDKNFIEKSGFPINEKLINAKINNDEIKALYQHIIDSIEIKNNFFRQTTLGYVYIMLSNLFSNHSIDIPTKSNKTSKNKIEVIKNAITYIRSNFQNDITIEDIAESCNMSKYYFCRTFSEVTGITAVKYINSVRCEQAKELLNTGEYSVSEISGICGFESPSYFTKIFKNHYGVTPNHYKNSVRS